MCDTTSETTAALLDLFAPRTVTLYDRGRLYTLICRQVEKADYLAYFEAFRLTSEQTEDGRLTTMDYQSAALVLVERVLISADGYRTPRKPLMELPDWKSRIPLTHRLQLAAALVNVIPSVASQGEFDIVPEGEVVSIDAVWFGAKGKMLQFEGLKHTFKTPTPAQHKRYRDAASRSLVIGGSRTGKTVFLGAHALLVDLYDELIVSTDGYVPHTVEQMDAYHKFVAAKELFDPTSTAVVATQEAAHA